MLPIPVYYVLLAACLAYTFARGGEPEKAGISIIAVGSVLSNLLVSARPLRFSHVETGIFAVDLLALAAFAVLAVRAERYWPLWIAALQLIGTAGHAVKMVDSHVIRLVYAFIMAFWTYPMLMLVVLGAWRHQRRLARFGVDRSWSSSSGHSGPERRARPIA